MEDKTIIRILGTKYTIKLLNVADDKELATCDGYCDFTTHEIIIRKVDFKRTFFTLTMGTTKLLLIGLQSNTLKSQKFLNSSI